MIARRRHGFVRRLLRGGAVGRGIRVRALLLASSRGDLNTLDRWVRWEACKGALPILPVALLGMAGRPLPTVLSATVAVAGIGWGLFVMLNAYISAFRMNRLHAAYMRAIGVDASIRATLANPRVWRRSGELATFRDWLAAMKAEQVVDRPTA